MATPLAFGTPRCLWAAGAMLGEGLCWSVREQALWWVDILGCRLHRWRADGEQRSWTLPDTISAVAERASAPGLLVTLRRGFAFFDPADGILQRGVEPEPERTANRFNDGKCDAQGRFWGGTMDIDCEAPTGALYRVDGAGRCVRAFDAGYPVTNGPAWSKDGRTMFVNDTARRNVFAFPFDPRDGSLGEPRLLLRFPKGDGFPDGMTTDAQGRLWIAHWDGGCVSCHDADSGAEITRIALPTSNITNVAFGGPALTTLFVTSACTGLTEAQLAAQPLAGALFAIDTDVAGCAAHLYAG
ncbi:MAG: SMP-30/gluconolactonase/LRE family protein [Piscinibacter sp.]|nr:SMP-30/gluconolactonase/LRE family protein [Piscinibacter sp.]